MPRALKCWVRLKCDPFRADRGKHGCACMGLHQASSLYQAMRMCESVRVWALRVEVACVCVCVMAPRKEELCNYYVWDGAAKKTRLCRGALRRCFVGRRGSLLAACKGRPQTSQSAARALQLVLPVGVDFGGIRFECLAKA